MKKNMTLIKNLAMGILLVAGITACTDDVTSERGKEEKGEATPAYLTISFNTGNSAGTRSTSDTGNVDGDEHAGEGVNGAEDSGHKNQGTAAEIKVNSVLVIACPTAANGNGVGLAKVYTNSSTTIPTNNNFWVYQDELAAASSTTATPLELAVGDYNIMVVVNPTYYATNGQTGLLAQGFTETDDLSEVQALYNKVLNGTYTPDEITVYRGLYLRNYDSNAQTGHAAETSGFTMANKAEVSATLTNLNTPDNPAVATVEVERMLSKITYRDKSADSDFTYPVTIETEAALKLATGYIVTGLGTASEAIATTETTFNVAIDALGTVVYATYKVVDAKTVLDKVYRFVEVRKTEENGAVIETPLYAELTVAQTPAEGATVDKTQNYYVADVNNPEASLTLQHDVIATETYNVTIEGYALINLSKTVNYVRHTVYDSKNQGDPFGTLNGLNWLWTPGWEDKNTVTFDEDGNVANFDGTKWYYNTLAQVAEESGELTVDATTNDITFDTYYTPMSAMTPTAAADGAVAGTNHYTDANGNGYNDAIGDVMGYCLENSTDLLHQTHGLSTAISFVATVTKEDGTPVEALYKYAGHTYTSLLSIQKAYGASHFADGFEALVTEEQNATDAAPAEFTKEELMKFGIVKYESNVCYYYTNEIKHFDNGNDAEMGNMEFAIMRNNIYSLAITNISAIGDPYLDPTPGITDEAGQSALEIEVKILPWIVRYNDIDF